MPEQSNESLRKREGDHILWIDIAKVLTMILVIIGHSAYYRIMTGYGGIDYMPSGQSESIGYSVISIINGFIYSFHMPFFMAISGMTMKISIERVNKSSGMIRKKARRLLIPFLTVSIFLAIPLKFFSGYWVHSFSSLADMFFGQILLMGNSHLWFIVSLFTITIVHYFIYRARLEKGWVYWIIVFIISLAGRYVESRTHFLGIGASMKYYLFFASGFSFFEKINKYVVRKITPLVFSWLGMFAAYMFVYYTKMNSGILSWILYYILALWGCLNMVGIVKLLENIPFFRKNKVFKNFSKNSYELYLYSDPFNYLLITIFSFWMGYGYVTDTLWSIMAYLLRIVLSIALAYLVIWLVSIPGKLKRD